jgi:hypothetical protein
MGHLCIKAGSPQAYFEAFDPSQIKSLGFVVEATTRNREGAIMIPLTDVILFAHPTFGVLAILASVWVLVELLNANPENRSRARNAALVVTVCMVAAWVLGGYWYVNFYYAEKAAILKGPWPWAHNIVMETKEHLFFIPLVLALYLTIVMRDDFVRNLASRYMAMAVVVLIIGSGLVIEGGGALINAGAKVAFIHSGVKGAE